MKQANTSLIVICVVSSLSGLAIAQQNWPPSPVATFKDGVYSVPDEKGKVVAAYDQGATRDLCLDAEAGNWTDAQGNSNPDWEIQNGVIRRLDGNKDLFLKGGYTDFVLDFEFKVSFAGNSGVFFHSWNEGDKARGHEYQIIDDLNRPIHPKLPRYFTGSFYSLFHRYDAAGPIIHLGYNKGRIMVMGNHVELWLNDKLAVNVKAESPLWKCLVHNSRHQEDKRFGHLNGGKIALQNHDYEVWFRNVKLTVLSKKDALSASLHNPFTGGGVDCRSILQPTKWRATDASEDEREGRRSAAKTG